MTVPFLNSLPSRHDKLLEKLLVVKTIRTL